VSEPDTERTLFLQRLLADQERGALAPLETYVSAHPTIADFVRAEYSALLQQPHRGDPTRYVDQQQLATGGMGQVWLATDRLLGRKVVLKIVRGDAAVAHGVARLQREARLLGRLDHPGICRILDAFEHEGQWVLVLPCLQGSTLAERIERAQQAHPRPVCVTLRDGDTAPGPLPAFLDWYARLVDAVHAAHEAGVVHRDLKPANLFVLDSGEPVVLDFGLALDAGEGDQRLTLSGEILGTPLYMAPEQVESRTCSTVHPRAPSWERRTPGRGFASWAQVVPSQFHTSPSVALPSHPPHKIALPVTGSNTMSVWLWGEGTVDGSICVQVTPLNSHVSLRTPPPWPPPNRTTRWRIGS
jgi:serine/threonine protein kinase